MTRVLVCGGRNYDDVRTFVSTLDSIHNDRKITQIIHGGARGADSLADTWGELTGVPVKCFPANWKSLGRVAGPIRNSLMLEEGKPDLVVAFPGGFGTANMVRQARKAGIHVIKVD